MFELLQLFDAILLFFNAWLLNINSNTNDIASFQEAYSRAGPGVVYNQSTATNGTSPVSPVTSAYSESNVNDARPHIKYVRAASSIAGSSANQAAFLTMTSPGVLELTGLAGVNPVLTAHHNVQFLGSSLKVLTPGNTYFFFLSFPFRLKKTI